MARWPGSGSSWGGLYAVGRGFMPRPSFSPSCNPPHQPVPLEPSRAVLFSPERSLRCCTHGEGNVETQTMMIIAIAVLVVVLLGVGWIYAQRQRHARLRSRFGPEYDRALKETGAPAKADALLEGRVRRVERFKIHPLSREQGQ